MTTLDQILQSPFPEIDPEEVRVLSGLIVANGGVLKDARSNGGGWQLQINGASARQLAADLLSRCLRSEVKAPVKASKKTAVEVVPPNQTGHPGMGTADGPIGQLNNTNEAAPAPVQ